MQWMTPDVEISAGTYDGAEAGFSTDSLTQKNEFVKFCKLILRTSIIYSPVLGPSNL